MDVVRASRSYRERWEHARYAGKWSRSLRQVGTWVIVTNTITTNIAIPPRIEFQTPFGQPIHRPNLQPASTPRGLVSISMYAVDNETFIPRASHALRAQSLHPWISMMPCCAGGSCYSRRLNDGTYHAQLTGVAFARLHCPATER
jgi:hypothetical protein